MQLAKEMSVCVCETVSARFNEKNMLSKAQSRNNILDFPVSLF